MDMKYWMLASALLMGCAACSDGGSKAVEPRAEMAATAVREQWKALRKAVEIEVVGRQAEEMRGVKRLGFCIERTGNMTAEEYESLAGVPFTLQGKVFVAEHPNVALTDSVARMAACYPYKEGLMAGDTLHLKAPFGEWLYGKEVERSFGDAVHVKMEMRSGLALLRVCMESDNLHDRLEGLQVAGEPVCTEAVYLPYEGRWMNRRGIGGAIAAGDANCLLNNGRQHDFYLIPTDSAGTISVRARVNGKEHVMKTAVPPMLAGSLTRLGVKLSKGVMMAGSSWVETERKLELPTVAQVDTVQVGDYLWADGTISRNGGERAVAVVTETDGRHGKAVALADCEGVMGYGKGVTSGVTFATVDGKRKEGIMNPEDESVQEAIVFKPRMKFDAGCALGYLDGATLTQKMMTKCDESRAEVLAEVAKRSGCYVPTLGEMARLFYLMQPYSKVHLPEDVALPQGCYLTCSEGTNGEVYTIDMATGVVTSCSKAYGKAKVRLFYLF